MEGAGDCEREGADELCGGPLDQADLEGWALIFGAEEEADLLILKEIVAKLN